MVREKLLTEMLGVSKKTCTHTSEGACASIIGVFPHADISG